MAEKLLNDRKLASAKPLERPYRLHDGGGLALYIAPSGVRSWQFRYAHDGREQTSTLGRYPDVSLAAARTMAARARVAAAAGEHLTAHKRVARAKRAARTAATFVKLVERWLVVEAKRAAWTDDYRDEVAASLRNHLQKLDELPVVEITAAVAAPSLRTVEAKAPDMAKKVRARLRAILDYAVEEGMIAANPIPAPRRRRDGGAERRHLPAVLDREGVGRILREADAAELSHGVRRAHLLAVFTMQRIGEIVGAEWSEVDLKAGTWSIPRERMKRKDAARGPHVVPLPPRLLASMVEWHRVDGDDRRWLCPAPHADRPVTREALEKLYRRGLGLTARHSPHSWRTVFSTWARDAGKDGDAIEAQLDHVVGSKVAQAYDRAKRLEIRRAIVAWHEAELLAARDKRDAV